MKETGARLEGPDDGALLAFFRAIVSRDRLGVSRRLGEDPRLVTLGIRVGASRQDPEPYFLREIRHYVYAGDTALHIAAAARQRELAELLVVQGAEVRARNQRGAEPLHYAADSSPPDRYANPNPPREVITYLIGAGADPDAMDKSGVAPLHRAVRTRNSDAVASLIDNGADPRLMNKSGSTPLHLAVQNTGKSGSGSDSAKDEQRRIIAHLLEHGARPTDVDAKGKTVADAATSDWIRELLADS